MSHSTNARKFVLIILALIGTALVFPAYGADKKESPAPEVHAIHVQSTVVYRCYGGYGKAKVKDTRTGFVCDNKTYKKTLIDKTVMIKIQFESNPDDDKSLVGGWEENTEFMGRKFVIAITLFKNNLSGNKTNYELRLLAEDNEPLKRSSVTFTKFPSLGEMNPVNVQYNSKGLPEEIDYNVTVTPGGEK